MMGSFHFVFCVFQIEFFFDQSHCLRILLNPRTNGNGKLFIFRIIKNASARNHFVSTCKRADTTVLVFLAMKLFLPNIFVHF